MRQQLQNYDAMLLPSSTTRHISPTWRRSIFISILNWRNVLWDITAHERWSHDKFWFHHHNAFASHVSLPMLLLMYPSRCKFSSTASSSCICVKNDCHRVKTQLQLNKNIIILLLMQNYIAKELRNPDPNTHERYRLQSDRVAAWKIITQLSLSHCALLPARKILDIYYNRLVIFIF